MVDARLGRRRRDVQLRDLIARLRTIPEEGELAMGFVPEALVSLLDADLTAAYRPDRASNGWSLGFLNMAGYPETKTIKTGLEKFLASAPASFALFDPDRPAPEDRNHVVRPRARCDEATWVDTPIVRDVLRPHGLGHLDQIRVLVCDGPSLLSWVGALRARPFGEREVGLMARLQPALTTRLRLERKLNGAQLYWECLTATLDSIASPAFLLMSGRVEHANLLAKPLLDRDRGEMERTLASSQDGSVSRAQISISGVPSIELCIVHEPRDNVQRRLEALSFTWRLTPAEARVLRHLVQGDSNKTIATKLACAEVTVEYHVTRVMRKAGADGRTKLLSRFWMTAH